MDKRKQVERILHKHSANQMLTEKAIDEILLLFDVSGALPSDGDILHWVKTETDFGESVIQTLYIKGAKRMREEIIKRGNDRSINYKKV